jgi:hypothetical protein
LTRTAQIALDAAAAGIQPIEVILTTMRESWAAGDRKLAAQMAEVALPYTTPRLASTTVKSDDPFAGLSYEQLLELADRAGIGDKPRAQLGAHPMPGTAPHEPESVH